MNISKVLGLIALMAAALLSLLGCGNNPFASPTPTPMPTPIPIPTATPLPRLAGVWIADSEESISAGSGLRVFCQDGLPQVLIGWQPPSGWWNSGEAARVTGTVESKDGKFFRRFTHGATLLEKGADGRGRMLMHNPQGFMDDLSLGDSLSVEITYNDPVAGGVAGTFAITGAAESYKHLSCVHSE